MFAWDRDFEAEGLLSEETHISKVYLGPQDAWKIKKPVDFGFLDYSTIGKRKEACEAEVRLNRRFAPSVYLGVVPLVRRASGHYGFGGEGEVADWAVRMRRLPVADRADNRLAGGRLALRELKSLAARLAEFHAAFPADADDAQYGNPGAVARNLEENFIQSRPFLADSLGAEMSASLEALMTSRFRDCASAIGDRFRDGRVCDGHGDLRLGQIYFDDDGRSEILDCIEFNDRFRFADPACDIAFLAMDLSFRGRPDLAEGFLAAYASASGDYGLYSVVDFYQAYRACVRGKVAGFLAGELAPGPERERKIGEARAYFRFAAREWNRAVPAVIAIGGGIGTGKSTLAERLGDALAVPVIASDPLRKRMAGVPPAEKRPDELWQGLYSPETTAKVYAEAARLAGLVGDAGRSVIVDASFRGQSARKLIRDAALRAGRPFLFIECRADAETCRERLRRRALQPGPSDGNVGNFEAFLLAWEPAEEIPPEEHLIVRTARAADAGFDQALWACMEMRRISDANPA